MRTRGVKPKKIGAVVFFIFLTIGCSNSATESDLNVGARYKILKTIYLKGIYNDLNDRSVTPETARAYLIDEKHANQTQVAFQVEVPPGTVMTVVSSAGSVLHFPYLVDKYYVKLSPDVSRGLEIILTLDRGMEGQSNSLNQELFRRIDKR